MAEAKRLFVDGPYGQTHLRMATPEAPSRAPLICLHMFPQSGRNFERFVEAASGERVVVAPDFPGHGESDAPDMPITAADYARSIWSVVDALGLAGEDGKVDFFGIHAGAKLAVEAACQRPDDVRKVVLSSAAVFYSEELENLRKTFSPKPLDEAGTRFDCWWGMITRSRPSYMSLEMCADAFAEVLRGGEKYEWGHQAVFDYNLEFPERLKALAHPVALLNPRDELYDMTLRSLDYLQNAELFDLPDWSHGFLEAFAKETAGLVCGWLDKNEAPARSLTAAGVS